MTLSVSSPITDTLLAMNDSLKRADDTGDGRLKALYAVQAARAGWVNSEASADQAQGLAKGEFSNSVKVQLSVGSSKSTSESELKQNQIRGSNLTAGGDATLAATGSKGTSGDLHVSGSAITGNKVTLAAQNDLLLDAAGNHREQTSKNNSSGWNAGVHISLGDETGIGVSASGYQSKGATDGKSTEYVNSRLNARDELSLSSGRDTMLSGAQALGDKIKVDAGRDLSIGSLQDTDDYHSWQKDVSGGASFTFGSMSGSASLSMSQTKIESEYASVGDQSGLFAGDKGFDINVGNHTQLNGGVIASTADSIKNQLSTGSLGWDAIDNKAEYNASSSGFGISTSGPTGGGLAKEKGKAAGTTQSAVAAGNIDIRNTAAQTQDIAELSRDTDNANGRIDKIFDEAKVKDNLAFTQGVTQLATQLVSDYGNKQMLQAQRAAAEKLSKDPAYLSASAQERQKMLEASPEYKAAQKEYGIGSNFWAAGTAISAALAGISGGDIGAAAGGALAPYLAREIKTRTEGNTAANAAAHAVAGALVALVSGNNVASGAAGAASGELAAKIISEQYYGKDPSALTEAEKQNVSALSQLASGLAGGLVADSTTGAVGGSVAGKTAVENNLFGIAAGSAAESAVVAGAVGHGSQSSNNVDEAWDADDGSDPNKSREENARKPNVAKDLTDGDKAELGGAGTGTPGGHGPEDEENARNSEASQSKANFNTAKDRYPKQYDQYSKLPDKNLEKAIGKHEKQIAEHKSYLNDPVKRQEHVPDWDKLSPQHQENLLHHWQQDINRHEAYKAIAEGVLKGRN